jgi:hypothetical protein
MPSAICRVAPENGRKHAKRGEGTIHEISRKLHEKNANEFIAYFV